MCIYPPCFIIFVSWYIAFIFLVCLWCLHVFCWKCVNKLRLQYKGTLKYLGESVTGVKIGLRKRWRGLDAFIAVGVLAKMLADVQTNVGSSNVHVQWFTHWKIRADDYDIISWHHEDLPCCGENYKRRVLPNLRAVIWVFWYKVFGSVDEPQTLYFGCVGASRGEEHIQHRMCDLFIHMHVPRPFWGTLSWGDFICLMVAG